MSESLSIEAFASSSEPLIDAAITEAVSKYENKDALLKYSKGGKHLRGKLALLSYYACGGKDEATGLKVAVSSELFQSASLIKDDMIDNDEMRRGQESAWKFQGNVEALRTADTIIIAGLDAIVDSGRDLVKTALGSWLAAWKGEAKEYSVTQGIEKLEGPVYKFYMNTIKSKTASLFTLATRLGAQAAESNETVIGIMSNYGTNLGIAYQLCDDYVDMRVSKLQAIPRVGAAAASQIEQNIKESLINSLSNGKFNIGQMFLEMNVSAIDFYKSKIKEFADSAEAYACHMAIPATKYQILLRQFPNYCINQMLKEGKVEL